MKRMWSLILAAAMLLSMAGCSNTEKDWQEQYDLGMRYLEEGDYEEAILAFSAAIEIDGGRPEAYIGRAEAYIATGDLEKALKDYKKAQRVAKSSDEDYEDLVDELEDLIDKLEDEIENQDDQTAGVDMTKLLKAMEVYSSDGALIDRYVLDYDEKGQLIQVICESYDNGVLWYSYTYQYFYDEDGHMVRGTWGDIGEVICSYDDGGKLTSVTISDGGWESRTYEYDGGTLVRCVSESQICTSVTEYSYSAEGKEANARTVTTSEYGEFESTATYTYDAEGKMTTSTEAGAEGTHYRMYHYLAGVILEEMTFDYTYETDLIFRIQDPGGYSLWSAGISEGSYTVDGDGRLTGASGYSYDTNGVVSCTCVFYYGQEEDSAQEEKDWQKTEASDVYSLYKEYFYNHFSDSDIVYLADVTHDGVEDMLVVNFLDEYHATVYGHVFTVLDGEVVEIYTKQGSDYHAGGFFSWYLVPVPDSDYWNLASETFGMWQGIGVVTYREYLLTNEGYAIDVSYLELDSEEEGNHDSYGMVTEAAWSAYAAELNAELADCYRIYCSSSNGSGSKALDTNPASVFGQ